MQAEGPELSTVYLALGTNQGDRAGNLAEAVRRLSPEVTVAAVSSLYETEPAYVSDQPRFLNMALRGSTALGAEQLLQALKTIERAMGRTAGLRYGPRPIDIDILLYGEQQIDLPALGVPHPRMAERPFVLVPLAELAPDLRPPGWGATVGELAGSVRGHGDILARYGRLEGW